MTREEALNKYANKIKTKEELVLYCNIINDIYDDFASRTCESCSEYLDGWCDILSQDVGKFSYFTKDFGCNKWEAKD